MLQLTNRELGSAILIGAAIVAGVAIPGMRRSIGPSARAVLRAFFDWKLQVSLLAYLFYAALLVYFGWRLRLWHTVLLKDTLIIVLFVGIPMVFKATRVKDGGKLVRDVVRDVLGISALIVFYLNLESLPLWAEIPMQLFVLVVSVLGAVAQHNPDQRPIERLCNGLLAVTGISLLAFTSWRAVATWDSQTAAASAVSFVLSVALPLLLLPYVYVFAFITRCESILTMLPFMNDGKQAPLRVRLAGIWGLRFSTRLAAEFTGPWRGALARSLSAHDALGIMQRFRAAVEARDQAMETYHRRLQLQKGCSGTDADGLQLDRREFGATKRTLTRLQTWQMGWYQNQGERYRPHLVDLLTASDVEGLPEDHGIQLRVRKDGRAWRAWRRTPGGWWFGVGGTAEPLDQWQYDGASEPTTFPSPKSRGWVNTSKGRSSPEWAHDDDPPKWVKFPYYDEQ